MLHQRVGILHPGEIFRRLAGFEVRELAQLNSTRLTR